ncbi:MAG: hypothetical protein J5685_09325 [Clostridiales bacterium]|nr:hypothetical protein [Clostridiales bacterium]
MKRVNKATLRSRCTSILQSNEGSSLVLVSIIAIIIIASVVILRVTTNSLWASADKQLNQDQAYELATSLGETFDTLISNNDFNISSYATDAPIFSETNISGLSDASVFVYVDAPSDPDGYYVLRVVSHVANASYTYTANYTAMGKRLN